MRCTRSDPVLASIADSASGGVDRMAVTFDENALSRGQLVRAATAVAGRDPGCGRRSRRRRSRRTALDVRRCSGASPTAVPHPPTEPRRTRCATRWIPGGAHHSAEARCLCEHTRIPLLRCADGLVTCLWRSCCGAATLIRPDAGSQQCTAPRPGFRSASRPYRDRVDRTFRHQRDAAHGERAPWRRSACQLGGHSGHGGADQTSRREWRTGASRR